MTQLKAMVLVLIGVVIIVLAVQNNAAMSTAVQFRFNPYFYAEMKTGGITLYELILAAFILGVLCTGVNGMVEGYRLRRRVKALTKELQAKDRELSSLRNLPITSEDVRSSQPGGI